MREALASDELDLHYQPLVDIGSEQVIGVEALLRWHLPEEGWIPPAEIIPIAEATAGPGRLKACHLEWLPETVPLRPEGLA